MDHPESIKKSPFLATIDLVLKELNERQEKGQLGKFYSQAQKNRIAMKFVDLYDRVKKNQRMAMQDTKVRDMSRREKENFMMRKKAQDRADDKQETMQIIIRKHENEKKEEAKRKELLDRLAEKKEYYLHKHGFPSFGRNNSNSNVFREGQ